MEELKTHIGYEKLCEKLNSDDVKFEHKPINTDLNATTTIASKGKMLARAWVEKNSFALKDPETGKHVCFAYETIEQGHSKVLRTIFDRSDDIKDACVFNADIDKIGNIYLNNNTQLLKTPDDDSKTSEQAILTPRFFQGTYLKNSVKFERQPNGNYIIRDSQKPQYALTSGRAGDNLPPEKKKVIGGFLLFKSDDEVAQEWELVPLKQFTDTVIGINIKRPKNFHEVANDETMATSRVEGLPENKAAREWIWMVKDYVWEMISTGKENVYKIKLIADDKPDMYLFYQEGQDRLITGGGGDEFEFVDKAPKYLKNVKSGKYVNITDDGEVVLQTNFAELAMCPLK